MSRSSSAVLRMEDDFVEAIPPRSPVSVTGIKSILAQASSSARSLGIGGNAWDFSTTLGGKNIGWYYPFVPYASQPSSPCATEKTDKPFNTSAFHAGLITSEIPLYFPATDVRADSLRPFVYIKTQEQYGQPVLDAVQALLSSNNRQRAQLADRLSALHRDAIADDESVLEDSIRQFAAFFVTHSNLTLPKITLTPNGTIRVRWIQGTEHFIAIEFTGKPVTKMVAEIPRGGGVTAQYFISETLDNLEKTARAIGAWAT
jgi:hypothetical protein